MDVYFNIFWRTFLALEAAVVLAAMGWDWATDFKVNVSKLAFLSLAPLMGAAGAAFYAWRKAPAKTALGKALRAAVEKIAAGVVLVTINNWADVLALQNILIPLGGAAVVAFFGTYFSYKGQPPVPDTT